MCNTRQNKLRVYKYIVCNFIVAIAAMLGKNDVKLFHVEKSKIRIQQNKW